MSAALAYAPAAEDHFFPFHSGATAPRRPVSARRRTGAASLVETLAARYPVVRKLLSEAGFQALAQCYAAIEPSAPGSLAHYGQTFPDFLRKLGGRVPVDYLADLADFENARARAQCAPSVEPLGIAAFSDLSASLFSSCRVTLHPSVRLVRSRFPVVSLWEANQPGRGHAVTQRDAQSALVARVRDSVETWLLPAGGFSFFSALMAGASLQQAIDGAPEGFDLAANLTMLVASGLVVAIAR